MQWQPTPVFLPGESHGQRSLVSYSPRGRKESDTSEGLIHTHSLNQANSWATRIHSTLKIQDTLPWEESQKWKCAYLDVSVLKFFISQKCHLFVLLNFFVECLFLFWLHAMQDLSSPTRDQTHGPASGAQSLNHCIAREVPIPGLL